MGDKLTNLSLEDLYTKLDVPNLDIGNRHGVTDYIDFIRIDEVTHSVMKGIDKYCRKFIVIKFIVDGEHIMQTFFQRYNTGKLWMGCGHFTRQLIDTTGGIKDNQIILITNIIINGNAIILKDHIPVLTSNINKTVLLDTLETLDEI